VAPCVLIGHPLLAETARTISLQNRLFPSAFVRRSPVSQSGINGSMTGDRPRAAHRTGLSGKPVSEMPGFGGSLTAAIPVDTGPGGKRYRASGEFIGRRAARGRSPARAARIAAKRSIPTESLIEAQVQVKDCQDRPCLCIAPQYGTLEPVGVSLVRVRNTLSGNFQPGGWVSTAVKRCICTSSRGLIPHFVTL
jgi:hypothetical protein